MRLGIVGLPNVGKSALFNSLTGSAASTVNYMFATVEPNIGVVNVPDERLYKLAEIYNSKKITHAVIEFVDISGLVAGSSRGEGLGNQFLAHIREVDAIVHVVRCFDDPNVLHVSDTLNPLSDIETINLELIFSDLEVLERRISKTSKASKADKTAEKELSVLTALKEKLEEGICSRMVSFADEEDERFKLELNLLTQKPVLYAANIPESDVSNDGADNQYAIKVREYAASEGSEAFCVCAKMEEELVGLTDEEKTMFLAEMGIEETGLSKLITASYRLLGLISFLTAGPKETRAWTIVKGTKAPQAAGKIHSDLERGFIRAEIVNYDDLIRLKSYSLVKDSGLARLEGKEYVMKDSDVVLFRFNV